MRLIALLGLVLSAHGTWAADGSTELLNRAEQRIQSNQFAAAELLLKKALLHDAANTNALFRLGYVEYRQRKLDAARTHFNAVVKSAPPAYNSRYFLGRIALLENKPAEAATWLEPVVAAGATAFDAASQLARAYAAAGALSKALPALRSAIGETPWDGALYYRLGQLYKQSGENELARDAFATSVRLKAASREDVEILMRVSQLLSAGEPAKAVEEGSRILRRETADPDSLVALGVLYGGSRLDADALESFRRAAALDATLFQAQFNYGLALLKVDRASEAMAPLARAFQLLPQSQDAATSLGLAAVMNQEYAAAIAPLEFAWGRNRDNARLGALLGTAYLRSGAPAKAVPVFRAVAGRQPGDPSALLLLIEALDASGNREHALQSSRQARKAFPDSAQVQMTAAQQMVKAGDYVEARSAFEQVLRLNPGQPEAELGLADSLQRAGDHAAAIEHYRACGSLRTAPLGEARSLVALQRLDEARMVLENALQRSPSDIPLHVELSRVYMRLGKPELVAGQMKIIENLRAQSQ